MSAHGNDRDDLRGDDLQGEELALAEALRADFDDACRTAPIPSGGLVWWRASLRARADAAQAAERSLTVAHGAIGVTLAGVACGAASLVWRVVPALPQPSASVLVAVAAAVCVVVVPVALVLAFARDS